MNPYHLSEDYEKG